jgi:hypothetical protein
MNLIELNRALKLETAATRRHSCRTGDPPPPGPSRSDGTHRPDLLSRPTQSHRFVFS